VIVARTEHPEWLSNAYLVADEEGGHGVLVDGNGLLEELLARAEAAGIELTHVLLTHGHHDHVAGVAAVAERLGLPVVGDPGLAEALGRPVEAVGDGAVLRTGRLEVEALATPGHAPGHLAFLVDGTDCLTGDVLFRGTVGGTRSGGPTGFADLRRSVERLLALPPETRVHPGHREATTVGAEREANPFVRVWAGLDPEGDEPCHVGGQEARLVLWAPDYDGGHKAWVRYPSGEDAIVGGSQVER
jgi:glyoxylase-like metal-dependent hydrolase (beta-lactamase superfamily II)